MIIYDSHRRPGRVRVVNSRLAVYEVTYVAGPLGKQFAMKAVDVVKDKALGSVGNLAEKAFKSIKERIARLIRKSQKLDPVKLPSTEIMSANVSK